MHVDPAEFPLTDFLDQIAFENISLQYRYLHLFPKTIFNKWIVVLMVLDNLQCLPLSELKEASINSSW